MSPHETRRHNLLRSSLLPKAALALGCLAITSGCSEDTAADKHYQSGFGLTTVATSELDPLANACDESVAAVFAGSEQELIRAEKCLDLYSANIAVVDYASASDDATAELISDTEALIQQSTRGIIATDFTILEPANKATLLHDYATPDGCANWQDPETYGSYIASAVDTDLAAYDKVVALVDEKSCSGGVSGVASERYAEVFGVSGAVTIADENNGNYYDIISGESGITEIVTHAQDPSYVASHEVLHLFHLGHAGTLASSCEGASTPTELGRCVQTNPGETTSLDDFLRSGSYTEYGSTSVMGSPGYLTDDTVLSLPQIYQLEWPHRLLQKDTITHPIEFSNSTTIRFDRSTLPDSIAILRLETPLDIPHSNSEVSDASASEVFNRIMFTPYYSETNGNIYGFNLYVVGEQNGSVIDLGVVYSPEEPFSISVGDTIIDIETKGGEYVTLTPRVDQPTAP